MHNHVLQFVFKLKGLETGVEKDPKYCCQRGRLLLNVKTSNIISGSASLPQLYAAV